MPNTHHNAGDSGGGPAEQSVTHLLAALAARLCPGCGRLAVVRTSRGAVAYLRCPGCGKRWKRANVVRIQQWTGTVGEQLKG